MDRQVQEMIRNFEFEDEEKREILQKYDRELSQTPSLNESEIRGRVRECFGPRPKINIIPQKEIREIISNFIDNYEMIDSDIKEGVLKFVMHDEDNQEMIEATVFISHKIAQNMTLSKHFLAAGIYKVSSIKESLKIQEILINFNLFLDIYFNTYSVLEISRNGETDEILISLEPQKN